MLTFDEKNHFYFWNGARVPSTTQVCAILAPRIWPIDNYYLQKGKIIHTITQFEDEGVLDDSSVDPILKGYLNGYRRFKVDTGFIPTHTEYQFYSKKYKYCGRVDKYGPLGGYMSVVDVKSGAPHEADQYQAPAYLFGLKDNGFPCWRAWDLYLRNNGTYRLEEVKSPTTLFMKFLEGLKKWKEANDGNGS